MGVLSRNLGIYPKAILQLPLQLDVACGDQVLMDVRGNIYNFQG